MILFLNKDTNVAYAIEKNEFDEPGHVKYLCEIRKIDEAGTQKS